MAFIKLTNGHGKVVSADQGAAIWRVYNGETKGTEQQQAFVKLIQKIYLSRDNAPPSYLNAYPQPLKTITPTVGRLPYKD